MGDVAISTDNKFEVSIDTNKDYTKDDDSFIVADEYSSVSSGYIDIFADYSDVFGDYSDFYRNNTGATWTTLITKYSLVVRRKGGSVIVALQPLQSRMIF